MLTTEALAGPDRLLHDARIGRSIRVGQGLVSGTSDRAVLIDLVGADRRTEAASFATYLADRYSEMNQSYGEWVACLVSHFADGCDEEVAAILRSLTASARGRGTVDAALAVAERALRHDLAELIDGIEFSVSDTAARFDRVAEGARTLHDAFVEVVQTLGSLAAARLGQRDAENLLVAALASCTFYEPFWTAVATLDPVGRAVLLAEEFRTHWSGPHREGSVRIIETQHAFRLVLEPCGSGGALRHGHHARNRHLPVLPDASVGTWGRAREVPAYCSHCAHNERVSRDRLGAVAWRTSFVPDATAPCAWVIDKSVPAAPRVAEPSGRSR